MPTSFTHLVFRLFTSPLLLLQLLQNYYNYFCHCYHHYHTTLLLNTLLQILSYLGVVELTTQLLILKNILWLPLCRINKFGLNTLPSKVVEYWDGTIKNYRYAGDVSDTDNLQV